jgi:hypothetical protein
MVSFEIFVKSMPPSLSELKVTPSFCFPFKLADDVTATIIYLISSVDPPFFWVLLCLKKQTALRVHDWLQDFIF